MVLREHGMEPATARNTIGEFTLSIGKHMPRERTSPQEVSRSIMNLLELHSSMSIKEIIHELRLTPLAATAGVRELVKEGRVRKIHPRADSTLRYRLS